ncbi:UvrD-helicase domain-containing protein [Candidatus Berkelbacteria bacterium]|nr:UvrD-helicase domain-containing protein [Candidatus Berkelbacteria bacterium]
MDILADLNDKQRTAVVTTEGPVLILAGAGSGKTRALTHRIAYLISHKKVSPFNILAITFTNKAAEAMKQRLSGLLAAGRLATSNQKTSRLANQQTSIPWMGTFHRQCVKILRKELNKTQLPYTSSFVIYDSQDQLSAIKQALKQLKLDLKKHNPTAVASFISSAKSELMGPAEYSKYAAGYFQKKVAEIYPVYQRILEQANALDFDDLLMVTVVMFKQYPEILERYQQTFKYILIDEYQDTNQAQYELVALLAAHHRNIFVIGDDWQAIYSFRGANFKNIINFEKDYPDATVIRLEQNYRSSKTIVAAAQHIIVKNLLRSDKKLWTDKSGGPPVSVVECRDEQDEAEFILSEIAGLHRMVTLPLKSFVILYRTNAQSRAIEEACLEHGVPYRIVGGFKFYERREIKDMLAYLRLVTNPKDQVSFERVVNVPPRGIGPASVQDYGGQGANPHAKIQAFLKMVSEFRDYGKTHDVAQLVDHIFTKSGYYEWLNDGTEEGQSRVENVKELKTVAKEAESLEDFLAQVALVQDIDNYDESEDAITLMTLHNAKGLEFPVVFMAGMEEGLFPHSRSITEPDQLEEERRLCYVGMTRAMERLYLLHARRRKVFGTIALGIRSRFVDEVPAELATLI